MNPIAILRRHRGSTPIAASFSYQSRTRLALAAAIVVGLIFALSHAAGQI